MQNEHNDAHFFEQMEEALGDSDEAEERKEEMLADRQRVLQRKLAKLQMPRKVLLVPPWCSWCCCSWCRYCFGSWCRSC